MLTVLAAVLVSQGLWWQTALVTGVLAFYLLVVRLTRCRVETTAHCPCLWRVRGLLGTCDYHVGYKRGLPKLVRGDGFLGLWMFMWPRDDFVRAGSRAEPQPKRGGSATSERAKRPGYDWAMFALATVSALVAIAALIRDLIAG
ncbi:hypothetical protein [Amycolatopsis albidoflavus]|uniref:Uncharacterized protein n=1 Tax=Amycolatopsis albidoflavus TaxID=102226 RepID=A0ABW5I950_9PSEU